MASLIVPPGFFERRSHNVTWWLSMAWEKEADLLQSTIRHLSSAVALPVGRGGVRQVSLGERGNVIVRPYRRGGFVRHFVRDLYWDRPPRPFAELLCIETARQRGVATVEPIGARVEWVKGGLYRGLLVTRKAEGFHNLWEWLQTKPIGTTREATMTVVAQAIAKMHEVGIVHADLNLMNILVQTVTGSLQALLIDFDRARLFSSPIPRHLREQNLRRLRRSLDKLDPEGVFFSSTDLAIFCQAYCALALENAFI